MGRRDVTGDDYRVRSLRSGSVTAVDARSRRSFARHAHDEFGVGLVTNGAQRSWSGRGLVEAGRGDIITVNPGELHDGAPIGGRRVWSMLYLSPALVDGIVADLSEGRLTSRELQAPVVCDAEAARLFAVARSAALDDGSGERFEERLTLLLARLFGAPRSARVPHDRLVQLRARIDDDPASAHTLTELAAQAGLSRFQTIRGFSKLTGLTPHAYVMQRRLDSARRLIRSGATLVQAALDAGFTDQSHMHRIFTARHGFTPGVYAAAFRR
ncbi:AraC family transcriptional regulator [Sphingoaurantiacus capsulatus]|uniref:AraC family transcriptional regulator n=1 Tax=Sphingoaurantiacus capsulatus TaxID=1771310 RepID=A0ABV7XAN6_9SPHN